MKFIFWGGKEIGSFVLKNLLKHNITPIGIVHYKNILDDDVVEYAIEKKVPILNISSFRKEQNKIREFIQRFDADSFISVAFPFILPPAILKLVNFPINIHTGAIPKYRGHHPISAALLNDEPLQATTIHFMDEEVDAGDILLQDFIEVSNEDTILTIKQNLIELSFNMLLKVINQIENNNYYPNKQKGEVVWAPKRTPEDSRIDFSKESRYLHNFIRALVDPYPNAFGFIGEKRLSIKESITSNTPGKVLAKANDKYVVATGDGVILIKVDIDLKVGDILK